jgi:peptidoglycan hydrolase CwlO-like protein
MFNPDFNPYDALEQLHLAKITLEQSISDLTEHQQQQARLLEMLAEQLKHLGAAVAGLQAQNRILHHRLERLEETLL